MDTADESDTEKYDHVLREIIGLEREYFFEKRNVRTERQRKLREIIERHASSGDTGE